MNFIHQFVKVIYFIHMLSSMNWLHFQADKLQRDFDEMAFKLKTVEQQLKQAEDLKNDLQDKKEHVAQLRNQLEAEKLQRYCSYYW